MRERVVKKDTRERGSGRRKQKKWEKVGLRIEREESEQKNERQGEGGEKKKKRKSEKYVK